MALLFRSKETSSQKQERSIEDEIGDKEENKGPRDAKVTEGKPEEKDERTGQMTEETDLSIFFSA